MSLIQRMDPLRKNPHRATVNKNQRYDEITNYPDDLRHFAIDALAVQGG